MHYTIDAQKGNMAITSGRTLLQGHPSFCDHISANHAVQGTVLISVSFLILLLFSVKHTSSRFAVRSVRLNRPRYLGTAAARRLDGLCSLQGCLRCLLKCLCFVNLTLTVSPESACLQVVRSFTQRHKNKTLLQVLAKSKVWDTLWGLFEMWQASRLSGEDAACRSKCIFDSLSSVTQDCGLVFTYADLIALPILAVH